MNSPLSEAICEAVIYPCATSVQYLHWGKRFIYKSSAYCRGFQTVQRNTAAGAGVGKWWKRSLRIGGDVPSPAEVEKKRVSIS